MTTAPERTDVATDKWLAERSWSRPAWTVAELEAAKGGRTVSVVLPALNEEQTVASVVDSITPMLGGLVDEVVVLDSGSTDDTAIRALTAGARVVSREQALPELEPQPGKGEALWRSLAVTEGDIIAFVKTVNGVKPVEKTTPQEVDVAKYKDLVKSTFEQVLDALGIEWLDTMGMRRLDTFFG